MMWEASARGESPLRFERFFDAQIEDVWALWTTKAGLEKWYAPVGMCMEVLALDVQVGGVFEHVMTAVGIEQIAYLRSVNRSAIARVSGRFVEVVHHQRLRIRFDIDFIPGVENYPYDMVVEFYSEASRVRMVLSVDRHPDPEITRGAAIALTGQLQRLTQAVAVGSPNHVGV